MSGYFRPWARQTKEDKQRLKRITSQFRSELELSNAIEAILSSENLEYKREAQCYKAKSRADFLVYSKRLFLEAKISSSATDFDRAIGQAVRYSATDSTATWIIAPDDIIFRSPQLECAKMIGVRIVKIGDLAKELGAHQSKSGDYTLCINPIEEFIHARIAGVHDRRDIYNVMWQRIHAINSAGKESGSRCTSAIDRVKALEGV